MSISETDLAGGDMRPSWEVLTREVAFDTLEGDGRTLHARVVPYNVVAKVADPPHYTPYREMFVPGAFNAQLNVAHRVNVLLNYSHRQGISDVVGRGVALEDQPDGLHAAFRILEHPDGDKALSLVESGDLTGMSAEFAVRKSRTVDGVVQRIDARLANVALCRDNSSEFPGAKAAYPGAEVLAVRTEDDTGDEDEPPPEPTPETAMDSDLKARLEALGVVPVVFRAVVRKPWDGDPARFTDEEYARACLIDRGGDAPAKERCSLPVLEPSGDVNVNALGAAAAALRGARGGLAGVSAEAKAAAARKLLRYYRQAGMEPPPGIAMMAG